METLYTGSTGCTTNVAGGERGTVTNFHYLRGGPAIGAFVRHDLTGHMWYVSLGGLVAACTCGRPALNLEGHHDHCDVTTGRQSCQEVTAARRISRDEFDRLTGIEQLRADMGWTEQEAA